MNKMHKRFLIIGGVCTVLGILSKIIRVSIYKNNIDDYGLFGSLPSFFYIIGILFIIIGLFKVNIERKGVALIIFGTLGALTYEIEQIFSDMVFDIKDIAATIIGAIISLILYKYILRKYEDKGNEK